GEGGGVRQGGRRGRLAPATGQRVAPPAAVGLPARGPRGGFPLSGTRTRPAAAGSLAVRRIALSPERGLPPPRPGRPGATDRGLRTGAATHAANAGRKGTATGGLAATGGIVVVPRPPPRRVSA